MQKFLNKNIVVIGAGQTPGSYIGNGRRIAMEFAKEGANLFITARHLQRAEETSSMILKECPKANVFCYELDSTNESEVKAALSKAHELFGHIDVLVNNVGIMQANDETLLTMDEKTFDLMFDVNVKSAIFLYKNVGKYMHEGSSIVQIASIAGIIPGTNLYSLTKSNMIDVGQTFAKLYAKDGIRVNTVVLGKVQTSMAVDFNASKTGLTVEEINKIRDASIPLKGGQGTSLDTAKAVMFLASDDARYITGANLPVDGGESIGF